MDMEEFDRSRMPRIILILVDIIFNAVIRFLINIIMHYILYGISIFQNVFYSLPIFNNSPANQMLYSTDFICQIIIYIFLGAILPALGVASFMIKLLDYWSDFEENFSKEEELALYFLIGLISQLIIQLIISLH